MLTIATSLTTSTSLMISANYVSFYSLSYLKLSLIIFGNECKYYSYVDSSYITYAASSTTITNVPFSSIKIIPLVR